MSTFTVNPPQWSQRKQLPPARVLALVYVLAYAIRHKFHATLVRILTKTDLVRTFVSENLRVQDFNEVTSIRSGHHLELI